MEEGAGGLAVAAIFALAGRFVAGLAGLEALEFASGVVFIVMRPAAATGCGHGGGSAGGSRAAGTVTVGALAGAKADESRSVVSQAWSEAVGTPLRLAG